MNRASSQQLKRELECTPVTDDAAGEDAAGVTREKRAAMRLYSPSRLQPSSVIERHHHARPYATVILSGCYEEAGDAGRFRVEPGDVLLHSPFSAHENRISDKSAQVLDLPLPLELSLGSGRGRIADPDQLVRLSERDRVAAVQRLLHAFRPVDRAERDLPDLLAEALRCAAAPTIGGWADSVGQSREHVSRAFFKLYGVSPARYRSEARARSAWQAIVTQKTSLAAIATDAGYADQAHMTRAIKSLTGLTPTAWRKWKPGASKRAIAGGD